MTTPTKNGKQQPHAKLLTFLFGLCCIALLLVLLVGLPQPMALRHTAFRTGLALAAAGVAGAIPGMIRLQMRPKARLLLHLGSALTVFVLVLFSLPTEMPSPPGQNRANPPAASPNTTLTMAQYKQYLLEQRKKYLQHEQRRQDIEERLANLEEHYVEKLLLLEETREKLEQLADNLPREQLTQAQERLLQGDTRTAEQLFDQVAEQTPATEDGALFQGGRLAEDRLEYSKALRHYTAAVAIAPDNPEYLLATGRMARKMGDYDRARDCLERLLALQGQVDDRDTGLTEALNELTKVYSDQGLYHAAEPLRDQCPTTAGGEQNQGDPEAVERMNNLAALYESEARYEEADLVYNQVLAAKVQVLGKGHPEVASSLDNLAGLYQRQRRYEEAERLYMQALAIREQALGKEHLEVAQGLLRLANLYQIQNRYAAAEQRYQQALAIIEQQQGKDHPQMATNLNNLANLYQAQGRYEEAEPLYQRSLAILRAAFPPDHPYIKAVQSNYDEFQRNKKERP